MAQGVKISFLGGVGEIGKNMYALEYENDIIVLDAGMGFPSNDMLGIDCVVQNISYLVQNKEKVKALIITHGHLDHIGAFHHMIPKIPAPVYATKFTIEMLKKNMEEEDTNYEPEYH